MTRLTILFLGSAIALAQFAFAKDSDFSELEKAIQAHQWNEAAQTAYEFPSSDPQSPIAKLRGAYALFQRGYSSAALLVLSQITPQQWSKLPEKERRFAEIVILLQKNAPLNLISVRMDQFDPQKSSPYLADEIRFNKGRAAFEHGNAQEAKKWLDAITLQSRFYGKAHYLLGTLFVQAHDYRSAITEFSKVFDPSAFEHSSELWRDITTQVSNYWGPKVSVLLDTDLIPESKKIGELSVLALARSEYALGNYDDALKRYSQIRSDSAFYPRATLEKIWALLSLSQHDEAEKMAMALATNENSFEAVEARVVRALVLVDAGKSVEARQQLDEFETALSKARKGLTDFESSQDLTTVLPLFAQNDLRQDRRVELLNRYESDLTNEIKKLREENEQIFPAFKQYASQLEPLLEEAREMKRKFVVQHVEQRKQDLNRLAYQARLIRVETYLEDREKLRLQYKNIKATEAQQLDHDQRLAEILENAVNTAQPLVDAGGGNTRLAFRQSELLWELGDIQTILGQVLKDESKTKLADQYKLQALKAAQEIAKKSPDVPQVQFFIGFAQTDLGHESDGLKTLEAYVKRFPDHAHVPDAYRILADARFDANDFSGAETDYKKILRFQDSPVVGYALYKIGWCAYNRKDFARTLLGFEQAIVWNNQGGKEKLLTLQREAEHDLIMIFAEVGDIKKAREYFGHFLPGDPTPRLKTLAKELDHIGQYEKSSGLYRLLIATNPSDKENVSYEASILFGFHQLHRWNDVIDTAQTLANNYKTQLERPQAADSPAGQAEKIVRDAVMAQQFEYKKRPSPDSATRVNKLDNLYFSMFGEWPSSQEPRYLHAHFLLGQNDNAGAAKVFEQHWIQFGSTLKEPLREEALRNLIYALNQAEDKAPAGTHLTDNAKKIIQRSLEYEAAYPKGKHTRAISYLRPAMYFKYSQNEEALKEAQQLFELNPHDDVGQMCFKNLRATYYNLKNWEQTYNWASALLQKNSPSLASYNDDLKTIREEAYFLWTDQIKDDDQAADRFIKLADDPLSKRLRERSLYNAFVRKNKAGHHREALQIASRLEKEFPHFENLNSIAGVRAALYQEAGDYERAEPLLAKFLQSHDPNVSPEVVQQAEFNAGLIAEALGHTAQAQEYFRKAKRAPASTTESGPQVKTSPALQKRLAKFAANFESQPLPFDKDLAKRIQKGAASLEFVAKKYIDASANEKVSPDDAFEFYCEVPLLYQRYQSAVLKLGDNKKLSPAERDDLKSELAKIADPIGEKARDFARECLSKSVAAEHDGPTFRKVMDKWGWANETEKTEVANLIDALGKSSPWIDGEKPKTTESEILKQNYDGKGTEDSWYALARARWDQGRYGLSRLTVIDALHLFPNSGRLLNFYAVCESKKSERVGSLYTKAGDKGSTAAWANLAFYHLRGARLGPAREALKKAQEAGAFRDQSDLNKLAMEFIKP